MLLIVTYLMKKNNPHASRECFYKSREGFFVLDTSKNLCYNRGS